MNSKYESNCGFIIYNDGKSAIRCDSVYYIGCNDLDNISKIYINDKAVYTKSKYYKDDLSKFIKVFVANVLNHIKFTSNEDLDLDELVNNINRKMKQNE